MATRKKTKRSLSKKEIARKRSEAAQKAAATRARNRAHAEREARALAKRRSDAAQKAAATRARNRAHAEREARALAKRRSDAAKRAAVTRAAAAANRAKAEREERARARKRKAKKPSRLPRAKNPLPLRRPGPPIDFTLAPRRGTILESYDTKEDLFRMGTAQPRWSLMGMESIHLEPGSEDQMFAIYAGSKDGRIWRMFTVTTRQGGTKAYWTNATKFPDPDQEDGNEYDLDSYETLHTSSVLTEYEWYLPEEAGVRDVCDVLMPEVGTILRVLARAGDECAEDEKVLLYRSARGYKRWVRTVYSGTYVEVPANAGELLDKGDVVARVEVAQS